MVIAAYIAHLKSVITLIGFDWNNDFSFKYSRQFTLKNDKMYGKNSDLTISDTGNMQLQPTSKLPLFFAETDEDIIAKNLISIHKIDASGKVHNTTNFNKKCYFLNPETIKKIELILKETFKITGRCQTFPDNITLSMHEIVKKLHELVQKDFNNNLYSFYFDGGAAWRVLESQYEPIIREWCKGCLDNHPIHELITQTFKTYLTCKSNDQDWMFKCENSEMMNELVETGLVSLIADKIISNKIDHFPIFLQVSNSLQIANGLNKNSYLKQVVKKHPHISTTSPNLIKVFVETSAFSKAINIKDPFAEYFLRSVGNTDISNDCIFSVTTPSTTTPINSLCIDLTSFLNEGNNCPLKMNSFLGEETLLQAISDRNLFLITFDPTKEAKRKDFIRTMSLFLQGGRCYQIGWLEKIHKALLQECNTHHNHLPSFLAKQLITCVEDHHQNDPVLLFSLTFNTTALLFNFDHLYINEINHLWSLILKYIDSKSDPFLDSPIIIKKMLEVVRSKDFNFKDLYSIIQISSYIEQHSLLKGFALPTQTDGRLFIQIKMDHPKLRADGYFSQFTLFLPFDLAYAITHVGELDRISETCFQLHNAIVVEQNIAYGLNRSSLKKYVEDGRINFSKTLKLSLDLRRRKSADLWSLSFLLSIAHLSQKYDSITLRDVFDGLVLMFHSDWPTQNFKIKTLSFFQKILQNSRSSNCFKAIDPLFVGIANSPWETLLNQPHLKKKTKAIPLKQSIPLSPQAAIKHIDHANKKHPTQELVTVSEVVNKFESSKVSNIDSTSQVQNTNFLPVVPKIQDNLRLNISEPQQETVEILSKTIINKLETLKNKVSKQTIDELLTLFEKYTLGESEFEMSIKLFNTLFQITLTPPQQSRLSYILKTFHEKEVNTASNIVKLISQYSHYLEIVKPCKGYNQLMKYTASLLSNARINHALANTDFDKFVTLLLSTPNITESILKDNAKSLLHALNNRKLSMHIINLFCLSPKIFLKNSENLSIFISALHSQIVEDIEKIPMAIVGNIFNDLAKDFSKYKPQSQLQEICRALSIQSSEKKDYNTAQKWLKKERLLSQSLEDTLYKRAIDLTALLIAENNFSKAASLGVFFKYPPAYAIQRLIISLKFLEKNQFFECLTTLDTEVNFPNKFIEDYHDAFSMILNRLLNVANNIMQSNGKNDQAYSEKLCATIHHLIWVCQPQNSLLWINYIELLSQHASLNLVENAFQKYIQSNSLKAFIKPSEEIITWKLFLKRLSRDGSIHLVNYEAWFQSVTYALMPFFENELFSDFTSGVIQAFSKISDKKLLSLKADSIASLFSSERIKRLDLQPLSLSISSIFIHSKQLTNLHNGISALTCNLKNNIKVVKSANQMLNNFQNYIKAFMPHKDAKSISLMLNAIYSFQQYRIQGETNFQILKYLSSIKNSIDDDKKVIALHGMMNAFWNLNDHPLNRNISDEEKRLCENALVEIKNSPFSSMCSLEFILRPQSNYLVHQNFQNEIKVQIKSKPKSSNIKFLYSEKVLKNAMHRFCNRSEFDGPFYLYKSEKNVVLSYALPKFNHLLLTYPPP